MRKIKKTNRRAYYFSIDAFIALVLILGVVLFVKPPVKQVTFEEHVHEDLMFVLSQMKVGEIDNSEIQTMISEGTISDLNKSLLEQMGEFYANEDEGNLTRMADTIMDDLNISDKNLQFDFENDVQLTYGNLPSSQAKTLQTTRQIIGGVQKGNSTKGFSARAFLTASNKVNYFYFGGYVGDGNLTMNITGDVVGARIEGVFSGSFDLFINNNAAGSYSPTSNTPFKVNLTSYLSDFVSGENLIEFKSVERLYVAGGFVRVVFNTTSTDSNGRKYFPGIDGLINIYDGFFVPSTINGMEVSLHYNSPYDIFFTVGNQTVYEGNSSGAETTVVLNNTYLSNLLGGYNGLHGETVPLRLGLSNVSYVKNVTIPADVFSVTDLSGSMTACGTYDQPLVCTYNCGFISGSTRSCNVASEDICLAGGDVCGTCSSFTWNHHLECNQTLLELAKTANKEFIDGVLNESNENENRVGLVGYRTSVLATDTHSLSSNNVSLKAEIDSWSASGNTCICCGVNEAKNRLASQSNSSYFRSMVVMTDGEANVECSAQGTTGDLDGDGLPDTGKDDAIQAACDAYEDYGIIVYTIAFGDDADTNTTENMAYCGGGDAHYGGVDDIIDIYNQIVQDILDASYVEQTIVADEDISTKLYSDSYVDIDYSSSIPYGLVITTETDEFGNDISEGSFYVPTNTTPIEARIISYSGSKWTSLVEVNNSATSGFESIFNLEKYQTEYPKLGDPYIVNIPVNKIGYGNNTARVKVGLSSSELVGGSEYNKIIYSLVKEVSSYSPILPNANGCEWNIEYEDGTTDIIEVPSNYSGSNTCHYNSSGVAYNPNDAINDAIAKLLADLDINQNDRIDTKFSENDLDISSLEISGIPFPWETEVQIRVWR